MRSIALSARRAALATCLLLGVCSHARTSLAQEEELAQEAAAAQDEPTAQDEATAPQEAAPVTARAAVIAPPGDPAFAPARAALAEHVRLRLREGGVPVVALDAPRDARADTPTCARAADAGAAWLVQVELRGAERGIDAVLRSYETESCRLARAARGAGTAAALGPALDTAAAKLLPALGGSADLLSPGAVSLADLAAESRALALLEQGELARAWRTLEKQESALARELRTRIDVRGAARDVPLPERVRLRAARGQITSSDAGARQMLTEAAQGVEGEIVSARVLLAAGELRLQREEADVARTYLAKAAELEPANPEAHLAHGRALALLQEDAAARRAFERAAELEPERSRALEELAELDATEPARHAAALLRAGDVAARGLDLRAAETNYARAQKLDPKSAAAARERRARLFEELRDPDHAQQAWQEAIDAGGITPARALGLARARSALGDASGAEAAFAQALELEPDSAEAALGLGALYTASGRTGEARPLLERAVALAPKQAEPRLGLAEALHRAGQGDAALEQLRASELSSSAPGFALQARVLRERGDGAGAQAALARAIELDPVDASLHAELAAVHELLGDASAAALEREQAELLTDSFVAASAIVPEATHAAPDFSHADERLVALFLSFGAIEGETGRVALLGVHEELQGKARLFDWLQPRSPALARLDAALAAVIGAQYELIPRGELAQALANPANVELIDGLRRFDAASSRDPGSVAAANGALGTDAIYVARVERAPRPRDDDTSCGGETPWRLELRQLGGRSEARTQLLKNALCLSKRGDYARWNPRALVAYGLLALALVWKLVRGWGGATVTVELPPRTRALFSISLSRRPRKVQATKSQKNKARAKSRIEEGLMRLNRFERPLRQGSPTSFSWIPARRRPYFVTVRGPLNNATTGELMGDFLEEQQVRIRRGKTVAVKFDLRPKEAVIEVSVAGATKEMGAIAVALRGDPKSLRYANDGKVFLYLQQGQYHLLVGAGDRLLERLFEVRSFDGMRLGFDLAHDLDWLFTGSKPAVTAYLEGDFSRAAAELERAGQTKAANKLRATLLRDVATKPAASAALFEAAGEYESAADAHRAAGDLAAAARAYEQAGELASAIECAKETSDHEYLLALYEKNGDSYLAGELALSLKQTQRAVQAFGQVDRIDEHYGAACRKLVELNIERGQLAPALAKLSELIELEGGDAAPLALRAVQARLLEKLERGAEALDVWEAIVARDAAFQGASARVAELRAKHRAAPAAAPAASASAAPAPIESRYEVQEELGRGAMGVVYKALDKRLGRTVALKRLTESLRGHPTALAYFEREARSAAALSHPNIVVVYDAGEENGQYFITMEYLQGTTLEQIVKTHAPMNPQVVASLGIQVCAGLHYAHANKIIHRDIKTANLFFTRERIVKIMDFGLAKMVEEVRKGATMISGTPYYMAPEQALGENVDHRADLYALGVTLFHLLTKTYPFASGDVTFHHRNTPAPDPRERVPTVPADLAALVMKLMAKRPDERPQSAAEVAHALQQIADALVRAGGGTPA